VRPVTVKDTQTASEGPLSVNAIYRNNYQGVVEIKVSTNSSQGFGGTGAQQETGRGSEAARRTRPPRGGSNAPYCPIRSPLGSFPICREITPRDSDSRPLGAAKGSSAFSQPREVLRQRGHGLRLQAERHTST